eukprot:CAMPEP_0202910380 /NCGR_PEP_ID=MMETSP1392-20130828/51895_1 /ASSEMBLY_ACC=CAM_ASM_000868 /TAXON_ID=225041 /ORGANISM="Chlamydomonas chlamydogama, Strain SAG 11-48b" /LENGTH=191 /DNA_ID=CAMNT_0049600477 /DNA_START=260 /DNA_END=831 /DNA_ORIENTATION=+
MSNVGPATAKDYLCFSGVSIPGRDLRTSPVTAAEADGCAPACTQDQDCTFFVHDVSTQSCALRADFFNEAADYSMLHTHTEGLTMCMKRAAGGQLPSPPNAMCYPHIDVEGSPFAYPQNTSARVHDIRVAPPEMMDVDRCARTCLDTPGCQLALLWGRTATCYLKATPFRGDTGATAINRGMTAACFMAQG